MAQKRLWTATLCLILACTAERRPQHDVKVYHFMVPHWGVSSDGVQDCGPDMRCEWSYADTIAKLKQYFAAHEASFLPPAPDGSRNGTITMSVYNIHSWWEKKREHRPATCELRTNMTLVESEESRVRYNHLFEPSFRYYDGTSTTHPSSSVQRIYHEVRINSSDFVQEFYNFTSLVKGASYVASDCHKRDSANANRDNVVGEIRKAGFRVDGLGRCMRSPVGPEGISLPKTGDTRYNLLLKRKAISRYMFNLAFENSIEKGYVTEKPFDALLSGTVPVYLGDAPHLKSLLPHRDAAIFLADFNHNATALVEYLNFLTFNETAFERHREWRRLFSYETNVRGRPLMEKSWYCRICEWAVANVHVHHKRTRICEKAALSENVALNIASYNGKALKSSGREIYYVQNGTLRLIPDLPTFFSLNLELANVIQLADTDVRRIPQGPPMAKKE
jgi:Glycosyltransferase family 10 (fucosyltransferase) C-term